MTSSVLPVLPEKRVVGIVGCALWAITVLLPVWASASVSPQQELVDEAGATVEAFTTDAEIKKMLRQPAQGVRALFILPDFFRWGFLVGGASGNGLLIVRDEKTGLWSQPVFYNVASMNVGAQVGADVSEIIVVVRSKKGVEQFYGSGFKLGASVGLAAGPTGTGTAAHGLNADMRAYARKKGLFVGVALGGAMITVAENANGAYYGRSVTPREIIKGSVSNPRSVDLRNATRKLFE